MPLPGAGKYDHITPAMHDVLNWLPVPQRILFKMALTAFDSICCTGFAYIKDVCIPVSDVSGRSNPRSVGRNNMLVPRTRTLLGRRSFRCPPAFYQTIVSIATAACLSNSLCQIWCYVCNHTMKSTTCYMMTE